jgi:hypothetical protein
VKEDAIVEENAKMMTPERHAIILDVLALLLKFLVHGFVDARVVAIRDVIVFLWSTAR